MRQLSSILVLLLAKVVYSQPTVLPLEAQHTVDEINRVSHILGKPEVLDSLVRQAINNSPTLASFEHDQALYMEEFHQKKRNWVSSFRLAVNVFSVDTRAYGDQSVTTTGLLPNVGVSLVIDPEKFINRKSYMRQAQQKYRRSIQQQRAQQQTLKVYIANLFYEYLELLECALMKKHILETRQQHYLTSEVSFKNGSIGYENLMIIQNSVQLAEQDVLKANIQADKKLSEIEIITGIK